VLLAQRLCDDRVDLRLGGSGERVQGGLEVDQLRDGVGVLAGGELCGCGVQLCYEAVNILLIREGRLCCERGVSQRRELALAFVDGCRGCGSSAHSTQR
jgi:hypothetical protein